MATVLTKKGGKRYATATAKIEPEREHTVEEAVGALKAMPGAKFDESVDLSLRLGVDPKHADRAVREAKAGKVDFRVDKAGNVHVPVGKRSFSPENIVANALAVIEAIVRAKPAAAKGTYLRTLTLSSTMSPGIKIDPVRTANLFKKQGA